MCTTEDQVRKRLHGLAAEGRGSLELVSIIHRFACARSRPSQAFSFVSFESQVYAQHDPIGLPPCHRIHDRASSWSEGCSSRISISIAEKLPPREPEEECSSAPICPWVQFLEQEPDDHVGGVWFTRCPCIWPRCCFPAVACAVMASQN